MDRLKMRWHNAEKIKVYVCEPTACFHFAVCNKLEKGELWGNTFCEGPCTLVAK